MKFELRPSPIRSRRLSRNLLGINLPDHHGTSRIVGYFESIMWVKIRDRQKERKKNISWEVLGWEESRKYRRRRRRGGGHEALNNSLEDARCSVIATAHGCTKHNAINNKVQIGRWNGSSYPLKPFDLILGKCFCRYPIHVYV